MRLTLPAAAALLAAVQLFAPNRVAHASQRHFGYTYETGTLPAGAFELEPWFTFSTGREHLYNGFDQRLELEYGVTDDVMTAIYLNTSAATFKDDNGALIKVVDQPGMSWEWKFKLADPVADAVGVGLYVELGVKPDEAELEVKLLLDKQLGDLLLALNLVAEPEIEVEADESEPELKLEFDLAAAWLVSAHLSLGVEVHGVLVLPEVESVTDGALYAGVTMGYRSQRWWLTVSVLPQIVALAGATGDSSLNLTEFERVESRLIVGFDL